MVEREKLIMKYDPYAVYELASGLMIVRSTAIPAT